MTRSEASAATLVPAQAIESSDSSGPQVASRNATSGSCHEASAPPAPKGAPTVALVGSPNCGKSTLFNALTGANRAVGNYPGTSVEVGTGAWPIPGVGTVSLTDLPGAYSLVPASPDEELTRTLLAEHSRVAVVVALCDSAHLSRSLVLLAHIRSLPVRVVVALTMNDVAARRGVSCDSEALSRATGVAVVKVDPRRRETADLARAVADALHGPIPEPLPLSAPGLGAIGQSCWCASDGADLRENGDTSECCANASASSPGLESSPCHERTPVTQQTPCSCRQASPRGPIDDPAAVAGDDALDLARAEAIFDWVTQTADAVTTRTATARRTGTDRVDAVLTAPILGPLVFLVIMWVVFVVTTKVAAPLQDAMDAFIVSPISQGTSALLSAAGLGGGLIEGFLVTGIIAGIGMLLTFVPLMAIMFALLAMLEDSGYMARAAVVTDRLMGTLGLPGRAFLPLVVGFGCNVPAISATRVLPDARHRLLTSLLVPFTSCSARLTVYVMVAATFFPDHAGTVVFAMYLLSIVLVILGGLLLRGTLLRTMGREPLVIDLPPYQRPHLPVLAASTWMRVRGFLQTAAGIIVAAVTVVWLLGEIPGPGSGGTLGNVAVDESLYAWLANHVAVVFTPAGFADWHAAGALIVGFVAKEAVISSWAQTYAAAAPADIGQPGALGQSVLADFAASSGGHPQAAALAFMVFLLAYTPCVATLAAQRRQIGARWTAIGVAMQFVLAWILAVAVFQTIVAFT